jgi:hypothetical protein
LNGRAAVSIEPARSTEPAGSVHATLSGEAHQVGRRIAGLGTATEHSEAQADKNFGSMTEAHVFFSLVRALLEARPRRKGTDVRLRRPTISSQIRTLFVHAHTLAASRHFGWIA